MVRKNYPKIYMPQIITFFRKAGNFLITDWLFFSEYDNWTRIFKRRLLFCYLFLFFFFVIVDEAHSESYTFEILEWHLFATSLLLNANNFSRIPCIEALFSQVFSLHWTYIIFKLVYFDVLCEVNIVPSIRALEAQRNFTRLLVKSADSWYFSAACSPDCSSFVIYL